MTSNSMARAHPKELHRINRIGWLRAAVMGANDGILSTASLVVGVVAAHAAHSSVLLAGIAGLVAGAMSMAAGEYVSVSSQADIERADLIREGKELSEDNESEHKELALIYEKRGLDPLLAKKVAKQLMAKDALAAHARDELGISVNFIPHPIQAALASAVTFSAGAAMPLIIVLVAPLSRLIPIIFGTTLFFLAGLGALSAYTGGAPILRASLRVMFWGALAMGITAWVGALFGTIQ
jgi:VIT1/CCC1 family predicted Fe2+/Mn2+ transporter